MRNKAGPTLGDETIMSLTEESEGVYYDRKSYAGFWLRFIVDIIDFSFIIAVSIIFTAPIIRAFSFSEQIIPVIILLWAGLWFAYFVLLKRSECGTLGYCLCKVRILNLKGERPGISALSFRLMFALIGPLNILFDLLWLSGDENRQALRDKFAQTYVVKKNASPAGTGRIAYCDFDLWGWRVLFREVKRSIAPE